MSVKIRVSYTEDEELAGVIRLLSPQIVSYKVARQQHGKYKRAYIELDYAADPEQEPLVIPEESVRAI